MDGSSQKETREKMGKATLKEGRRYSIGTEEGFSHTQGELTGHMARLPSTFQTSWTFGSELCAGV